MIYYDSKHLSNKLGINAAKWKRWAREFLPPDPLGGLQSGVARQFNVKDAFKVYLGGFLVGEMKFTIPEAVRILSELSGWLKANGFFSLQPQTRSDSDQRHHVYIYGMPNGFAYCIRTIQSLTSIGNRLNQETFLETFIATDRDPIAAGDLKSTHLLVISALYQDFLTKIQ